MKQNRHIIFSFIVIGVILGLLLFELWYIAVGVFIGYIIVSMLTIDMRTHIDKDED